MKAPILHRVSGAAKVMSTIGFLLLVNIFCFISSMQLNLVTLISADNKEYKVAESIAKLSKTLKYIIDDLGVGHPIPLADITANNLEILLAHLSIIAKIQKEQTEEKLFKEIRITLNSQIQNFKQSDLVDLLLIANYLDIPSLLKCYAYFLAKTIPDNIQNSEATKNYFVNMLKNTGKSMPSEMTQYLVSMKKLIEEEASALHRRNNELSKLLRAKKSDENTAKIRGLIAEGVDINKRFDGQTTFLMKAVNYNNNQIVQDLINAGADVNLSDSYGGTALMSVSGASDAVKGRCDHLEIVNALINAKTDLNVKDRYNNTALYFAVNSSHNEVAKTLIKAGADVNIQGDLRAGGGRSPLNDAIGRGNLELIQALADAGADIWTPDRDKKSALELAMHNKRSDIVQILLHAKTEKKQE